MLTALSRSSPLSSEPHRSLPILTALSRTSPLSSEPRRSLPHLAAFSSPYRSRPATAWFPRPLLVFFRPLPAFAWVRRSRPLGVAPSHRIASYLITPERIAGPARARDGAGQVHRQHARQRRPFPQHAVLRPPGDGQDHGRKAHGPARNPRAAPHHAAPRTLLLFVYLPWAWPRAQTLH